MVMASRLYRMRVTAIRRWHYIFVMFKMGYDSRRTWLRTPTDGGEAIALQAFYRAAKSFMKASSFSPAGWIKIL